MRHGIGSRPVSSSQSRSTARDVAGALPPQLGEEIRAQLAQLRRVDQLDAAVGCRPPEQSGHGDLPGGGLRRGPVAEAPVDRVLGCDQHRGCASALGGTAERGGHQPGEHATAAVRRQHPDAAQGLDGEVRSPRQAERGREDVRGADQTADRRTRRVAGRTGPAAPDGGPSRHRRRPGPAPAAGTPRRARRSTPPARQAPPGGPRPPCRATVPVSAAGDRRTFPRSGPVRPSWEALGASVAARTEVVTVRVGWSSQRRGPDACA